MQYISQTRFDHEISYARILQHENGVRVEGIIISVVIVC